MSTVPGVRLATPPERQEKKAARPKAVAEAENKTKQKLAPIVDGPDYVEQRGQTQPSVLDIIKIKPGCAVRQGPSERKGPLVVGQVTRADFLHMKAGRVAASGVQAVQAVQPPAASRAGAAQASASGTTVPGQHGGGLGAVGLDGRGDERQRVLASLSVGTVPRKGSVQSDGGPKQAMRPRPSSPDPNVALVSAVDWGFSSSAKTSAVPAQQPPVVIPPKVCCTWKCAILISTSLCISGLLHGLRFNGNLRLGT